MSIRNILRNPKFSYIGLNISLSGLAFIRSFISLKYLNYYELGLVGIVQILAMVISMLQIGMVTGGYKMYSISTEDNSINNTVSGYILTILLITTPLSILIHFKDASYYILLFGIIVGALSLYNNWLTCMMLARGDLKSLNRINLISTLATFFTLPTIFFWTIKGVLLGTAIGPVIFFIYAMVRIGYLRPTRINLDWQMMRKILYYGFIPYLTTTFFYINVQIERWSIVQVLGLEALGKLSLCVILTAAFMIVPSSISNLYFPGSMKTFTEKNFSAFQHILKRYAVIILLYSLSFVIGTSLMAHIIVPLIFPKHVAQIPLIYWILPSLLFTGVNTILTMLFNAAFKYRAIITINMVGLLSMASCVFIILNFTTAKLIYFVIAESITALISFVTGLLIYLKLKNKIYL